MAWKKVKAYTGDEYIYEVRGKNCRYLLSPPLYRKTRYPGCVCLVSGLGRLLRWMGQENVPGEFPIRQAYFPSKKKVRILHECLLREGCPEPDQQTISLCIIGHAGWGSPPPFDSVTLDAEKIDHRPDIYGKIGNSGCERLLPRWRQNSIQAFDLCDPATSVCPWPSMDPLLPCVPSLWMPLSTSNVSCI